MTSQGRSSEALSFLTSRGVDLSKVTQLGGHSVPRSFSNAAGPNVGLAIIQALVRAAKELPGISFLEGTQVWSRGRCGAPREQVG